MGRLRPVQRLPLVDIGLVWLLGMILSGGMILVRCANGEADQGVNGLRQQRQEEGWSTGRVQNCGKDGDWEGDRVGLWKWEVGMMMMNVKLWDLYILAFLNVSAQ